VVLPQKLFEDKVLCDNYEQRYGLFFHTRLQEVSPVPACEDVGSVCFDERCVYLHSIGLRVCNYYASELTSICSPSRPNFVAEQRVRAFLEFHLFLFFFCGYVCFF
jgi:hypothetical protein